jgi:hypothetical protein
MHHIRGESNEANVGILLGTEVEQVREDETEVHELVYPIEDSGILMAVGPAINGETDRAVVVYGVCIERHIA